MSNQHVKYFFTIAKIIIYNLLTYAGWCWKGIMTKRHANYTSNILHNKKYVNDSDNICTVVEYLFNALRPSDQKYPAAILY